MIFELPLPLPLQICALIWALRHSLFGGTAAGKVGNPVSYEGSGATVVIPVSTNFVAGDTLTVSGLAAANFAAASTTTAPVALHTSGVVDALAEAYSPETMRITGALTVTNHIATQIDNTFSFQNKTAEPLFAFALTPNGENATVTDMVVTLSGIQGITTTNISNFDLYRDTNSDGLLDGGDLLIDGNGILTINGQSGAVTFSTDFLATTTAQYLIIADLIDIERGDAVTLSLPASGITAIGQTSVYSSYIVSTVSTIQHERFGGGGGGNSAPIGGEAPEGAGVETGGEEGGGGEVGQNTDGDNIAPDANFMRPSAVEAPSEWNSPENAYLSDGVAATATTTNIRQVYKGFTFGIPGTNTIQGLQVKVDASGSTAQGTIDVAISWDGGSSYTTAKATPTLGTTDVVYQVGGPADLWGRSWTAAEFDQSLFRLRITAAPAGGNTLRVDALEVQIYHQASGGGSGGGGGI